MREFGQCLIIPLASASRMLSLGVPCDNLPDQWQTFVGSPCKTRFPPRLCCYLGAGVHDHISLNLSFILWSVCINEIRAVSLRHAFQEVPHHPFLLRSTGVLLMTLRSSVVWRTQGRRVGLLHISKSDVPSHLGEALRQKQNLQRLT